MAMQSERIDMNTLDFACYLARLTRSTLKGWSLGSPREDLLQEALTGEAKIGLESKRPGRRQACEAIFQEACCQREIVSEFLKDPDRSDQLDGTRFSDLLIIDGEATEARVRGESAGWLETRILEAAECPVVVVPGRIEKIDELFFTYDGADTSMFAIKQFTYLFPQFRHKKVTLLEVVGRGKSSLTSQHQVLAWLHAHYDQIESEILKGDSYHELFSCLLGKSNGFVVMGAYGRNFLSRLFKPSHADEIIGALIHLPVFIAHP
jgi:hypothetical protein